MFSGLCCHFKAGIPAENHDDVTASEEEVSHRISFSDFQTGCDIAFKVDG